mgnify:FL=1
MPFDFSDLSELSSEVSRSISAENPDGSKSGGALEDPQGTGPAKRLGKG